MTIRNQNGQDLGPMNSGQFQGFAQEIIITDTVVVAIFDPDTDKTTVRWTRPLAERIAGEKYDIYRKPIFTPNLDGNYPITHEVPNDSVELIAANLDTIPDIDDYGELEYSVPVGTEGWYFYAVVIKYQGLSKKIIPDWGVWESVRGPNDSQIIVLTKDSVGHQKVSLSWTVVTGADGYKLYYSDKSMSDNSDLRQWKEPPLNAPIIINNSTVVTGLTNNTTYYFRVRAVNSLDGEGSFSNEVSGTPVADVISPDRVTDVTATDLGIDGIVEVCWESYFPPDDLAYYRIYYFQSLFNDISGGNIPYVVATKDVSCFNVTGLENDITYWFAVVPVDEVGNYWKNNLITDIATPTRPSVIGYFDPITVTVNNEIQAVSGLSQPHVIYGMLQLPIEYVNQISLSSIEIALSITLSSLGGLVEALKTNTDATGFWSINLADLKSGEWKDNDYILVNAKDWNSTFLGSAFIYADKDAGAQRLDILLTDSSLQPPILIAPIVGGTSEYPIFRFYSESQNLTLKFKIEVSDDNFRTILRVFDENENTLGWGREERIVGGEDKITASYRTFQDDRLVNGETYQWRAYSWNGVRYSLPSRIGQFNVVAEQLDKSSETWSFNIDAEKIVELFAVQTDSARYAYPNANGIVITDSTPTVEWKLNNITVHNVHFRLELDNDQTFSNASGGLKIYESKDNPDGFEYSLDQINWMPFDRMGAPSGVQYFRYVFNKNLEVI